MTTPWTQRVASVILSTAGLLSLVAPASAVIITTNYDPAFGAGPLNGYGWTATINYEVPKECFNRPSPEVKFKLAGVLFGCGLGAALKPFSVLSAEVGLYQVGNPDFLLDVLTFNPATLPLSAVCVRSGALDCAYSVVGAWGGEVLGIANPRWSNTLRGDVPWDENFNFRLGILGEAVLEYQSCPVTTTNCSGPWTRATLPTSTTYIEQDVNKSVQDVLDATQLRVGVIPEPGSIALALLALGAGLAATRRR